MSKIAILIGSTDPQALKIVREATGAPWSEILARATRHRPAAEFTLFLNDHEDVAARLRRLMSQLADTGIRAEFFELEPGEDFETTTDLEACRMTAEVVNDTLRLHEETLERLKREDGRAR